MEKVESRNYRNKFGDDDESDDDIFNFHADELDEEEDNTFGSYII